jgi:hypothetical protein
MTSYQVADVFHSDWQHLKADQAAIVLLWKTKIVQAIDAGNSNLAGFYKSMVLRYLCKKKGILKRLSSLQVHDVAEDLAFIHKPWYHFHINYIKTKHGRLLRPDYRMASFTFWQLVKADAEFSKFLILNAQNNSERTHSLRRLIAIIYQPIKGKFTDVTIEDHAKALPKALTYDLQYLIMHTYANIRRYLVEERCPDLFNGGSSTSESEGGQQYTGNMWQQMLFDLSETTAFAGLDSAKNARMFEALDYLNKKARENNATK